MRRFTSALMLLALVACSGNATTPPSQSLPGGRSPMLDVSSGGLQMTLYGPTPQFKETNGQIGVAYDGQGGLWLASPTAYEHRAGSSAYTINNGLNPADAHDNNHQIYDLFPLEGYVYSFGINGSTPVLVRVSSNGSRSVFPVTGATDPQYFRAVTAGAGAIYAIWQDVGSAQEWKLLRISDRGATLNTTAITTIDPQNSVVNALAVSQSTGEVYVLDSAFHSARIDRYAANGTLERTYDYSSATSGLQANAMAIGADGNLYIPNEYYQANCVFVLNTTTGAQQCYKIPAAGNVTPQNAVLATDGAVWFTIMFYNPTMVGRITTSGKITLYNLPYWFSPNYLAAAPKTATENPANSVWIAEGQAFDSIRAIF